MKTKILIVSIGFIVFSGYCLAADSWPGSSGTIIATLSGYEPSGILWHPGRGTLFVVDDDEMLLEVNTSGQILHSWSIGSELEGITFAEGTRYLYLGREHPDSILEFDLEANGGEGALSGQSWDLTTWMTSSDNNLGLEGLAYSDGIFYVGLQSDGRVYTFNVDLTASGEVDYIATITPNNNYTTDISGIDINSDTGRMYVIYDTANVLVELDSNNAAPAEYSLPGDNQEGIAVVPNCSSGTAEIYVAEDDGQIVKYQNYPVSCDLISPSAPTGLDLE